MIKKSPDIFDIRVLSVFIRCVTSFVVFSFTARFGPVIPFSSIAKLEVGTYIFKVTKYTNLYSYFFKSVNDDL